MPVTQSHHKKSHNDVHGIGSSNEEEAEEEDEGPKDNKRGIETGRTDQPGWIPVHNEKKIQPVSKPSAMPISCSLMCAFICHQGTATPSILVCMGVPTVKVPRVTSLMSML